MQKGGTIRKVMGGGGGGEINARENVRKNIRAKEMAKKKNHTEGKVLFWPLLILINRIKSAKVPIKNSTSGVSKVIFKILLGPYPRPSYIIIYK